MLQREASLANISRSGLLALSNDVSTNSDFGCMNPVCCDVLQVWLPPLPSKCQIMSPSSTSGKAGQGRAGRMTPLLRL